MNCISYLFSFIGTCFPFIFPSGLMTDFSPLGLMYFGYHKAMDDFAVHCFCFVDFIVSAVVTL